MYILLGFDELAKVGDLVDKFMSMFNRAHLMNPDIWRLRKIDIPIAIGLNSLSKCINQNKILMFLSEFWDLCHLNEFNFATVITIPMDSMV